MKTYKNIEAFEKRVRKSTDWDDYFMLDGRMYNIYEYGPGIGITSGPDYVYFINRRTHDAIKVEYDCPTGNWKKTGRIMRLKKDRKDVPQSLSYDEKGVEREHITTPYRFYSVEFIPDMELWREII